MHEILNRVIFGKFKKFASVNLKFCVNQSPDKQKFGWRGRRVVLFQRSEFNTLLQRHSLVIELVPRPDALCGSKYLIYQYSRFRSIRLALDFITCSSQHISLKKVLWLLNFSFLLDTNVTFVLRTLNALSFVQSWLHTYRNYVKMIIMVFNLMLLFCYDFIITITTTLIFIDTELVTVPFIQIYTNCSIQIYRSTLLFGFLTSWMIP